MVDVPNPSVDRGFFPSLAAYLEQGSSIVEGWLSPTTAAMAAHILVAQSRHGIIGSVCEIGVHHGKFFLVLANATLPGERAVAVDIFGDQDKNVDGSGAGDRAIFERNAAHYAPAAALDILQSSSLDLAGHAFTTRRFRFLSIDGGHTAEVTANDLRLAEQTLIPGGVVALDDILSHHWTGVLTGLAEYLKSGGTLVPFALVPNKLLLAQDAVSASMWLADLERHFPLAVAKRDLEFLGSRIISFDESAYYTRADYVAIRRQMSDLEDRLAACEAARQKARADLAQQTDSLQHLDATLAWHEQERVPTRDEFVRLQALWQRRVADLEGEVSALQSSTSWRVTSPMRMIIRLARRW